MIEVKKGLLAVRNTNFSFKSGKGVDRHIDKVSYSSKP